MKEFTQEDIEDLRADVRMIYRRMCTAFLYAESTKYVDAKKILKDLLEVEIMIYNTKQKSLY